MSQAIVRMAQAAQAYCELIEQAEALDARGLQQLYSALARLHAAVDDLAEAEAAVPHLTADLDARFELYSHLKTVLGPRDGYWMEFDASHGDAIKTGSLADDLTDIYCELKAGLALLDQDPQLAERNWRQGFRTHWGQHLVDAARHLFGLCAGTSTRVQPR